MSSFKFSYSGFTDVIRNLNLRAGKVRFAQNQLRKVGEQEIIAARERIFSTKIDPEGAQWWQWSPSTLASRMRRGTADTGLLYETGHLYNSFRTDINTTSNTGVQVIVSNTAKYAFYLQNGTSNMKPRPFFGWTDSSKDRINAILGTYLRNVVIEGK